MRKTFKEIHELWNANDKVPGIYLNKKNFYIDLIATRTTRTLPKSIGSHAVTNTQNVLQRFETWIKRDLKDKFTKSSAFPFGKDTHWVEIIPQKNRSLGSAFLVLHVAPEYQEEWNADPVMIIGCVARKAYSLSSLNEMNLIGTGRIIQMKSMHGDKYKTPRIFFPYGDNSFDENLGEIEEFSTVSSEDTTPECDFSMDEL
jgi:hypothetical protein